MALKVIGEGHIVHSLGRELVRIGQRHDHVAAGERVD